MAYPSVDMTAEFVDALEATRAYEANVGVIEVTKSMGQQTLRILADKEPKFAGIDPFNKRVDRNSEDNLKAIARCLERQVDDLVVVVMDRPRHEKLIDDIRRAGARIRLITDGDLSAGIAAAVGGSGVHAVMGIGGAPEGVLTAAAMRCLNGEIFGRLVTRKPEDERRCAEMGMADVRRVYRAADLASGRPPARPRPPVGVRS